MLNKSYSNLSPYDLLSNLLFWGFLREGDGDDFLLEIGLLPGNVGYHTLDRVEVPDIDMAYINR